MTTPPGETGAGAASLASVPSLEDLLRAFEQEQDRRGDADVADFLPPPGHPLSAAALVELCRVDLEFRHRRGGPASLEEYLRRFPGLRDDPAGLAALAYEDYRLRCHAGQAPRPSDYRRRYGVDTAGWPLPPSSARRREEGSPSSFPGRGNNPATDGAGTPGGDFPAAGGRFLGFTLVAELGRGAFGRVYLARQDDLAHRLVALKIATDLDGESQYLARLQHTHIVPIYSLHRHEAFQAVCMPYLGPTTLADVLTEVKSRPAVPESGSAVVAVLDRPRPEGVPGPALPHPATDVAGTPAAPALPRDRLTAMSYVEAVLWIGARLADGLAHAHDRGVIHRDLKPANVLLTDEGQPMLLDFNLAGQGSRATAAAQKLAPLASTERRDGASRAQVGGTLPYMAPEHIEAFAGLARRPDARADVYSLGVILYELLTGRHPFPVRVGALPGLLADMAVDRLSPPPRLRGHNPAVAPAAEAIVRRCLESDPARRYPSARHLSDDLERQLAHQPLAHTPEPSWREWLGKWVRRHRRLASASAVAAVAVVVLVVLAGALAAHGRRLDRYEAEADLGRFHAELREAQFLLVNHLHSDPDRREDGIEHCRRLLARFRVLDAPGWRDGPATARLDPARRRELGEAVAELLLLWARVEARAAEDGPPGERDGRLRQALALNERAADSLAEDALGPALRQRADLRARLGQPDEANRRRESAGPPSARDTTARAGELAAVGRFADALPLLRQATRQNPRAFWAWVDLGLCHEGLGQDAEAVAAFSTALALAPDFAPLLDKRGQAALRLGEHAQARADFERVLELLPSAEAHLNRALALTVLGEHPEALAGLARAEELGLDAGRLALIRARIRAWAGDAAGARRDRAAGLARRPTDEAGWLARGVARIEEGDAAGALADFDAARAINPRSAVALQNRAHVLSERLGRTAEAVATLDRLLTLYPDHPARAARAVLNARLGHRAEALADADICLRRGPHPAELYQLAGAYAQTSVHHPADRAQALALLRLALAQGYGRDLIVIDPDLDPLRDDPLLHQTPAGPHRPGK